MSSSVSIRLFNGEISLINKQYLTLLWYLVLGFISLYVFVDRLGALLSIYSHMTSLPSFMHEDYHLVLLISSILTFLSGFMLLIAYRGMKKSKIYSRYMGIGGACIMIVEYFYYYVQRSTPFSDSILVALPAHILLIASCIAIILTILSWNELKQVEWYKKISEDKN